MRAAAIPPQGAPQPRVALVSLPWTTLTEPSLGLGILRAVLDREGIACRVRHLNLFLLRHLRAATYYALANVFALNDFVFSGVLEPSVSHRQLRRLRLKTAEALSYGLIDQTAYGGIDGVVEQLLELRNSTIPDWLAGWAEEITAEGTTLVGFTCMFDQTIASLALSRLVKERAPGATVVLGGYAVRSPTADAIIGSFPWVDAVCVAEGETVIGPLAWASVGRRSLESVPGLVVRRGDGRARATAPTGLVDMSDVPTPNYDDFYADLERLASQESIDVEVNRLPIENSRGCWWGAAKHCVFCGIKDEDLVFRAADATRVIESLDRLHERYGVTSFRFSDYILPHTYYSTLLPQLVARGSPYTLTAEMKANVSPERFALLAAAGFAEVQPGVESFSTPVLRSMDKGVTAAQNVLTLMLGRIHDVRVHYNLLYGFPDDDEDEYALMQRNLWRLSHLDPPSTRLEVQVTRYAPLQVDPGRFKIPAASYEPSYELIFSRGYLAKSGFDLDDYCYYFARPYENSPRLNQLYDGIDRAVDKWKVERREREPVLRFAEDAAGRATVYDSRRLPATTIVVSSQERAILDICSRPRAVGRIADALAVSGDDRPFAAAVDRLDELGLIFRDGERIVSLVLPPEGAHPQRPQRPQRSTRARNG